MISAWLRLVYFALTVVLMLLMLWCFMLFTAKPDVHESTLMFMALPPEIDRKEMNKYAAHALHDFWPQTWSPRSRRPDKDIRAQRKVDGRA